MTLPIMTALHGLKSTEPGVVTFIFEDADGALHDVSVLAGTLNAMLLPILAARKEAAEQAQLLTVTRLRKMVDDLGVAILEIELDRIPLQMRLPAETLTALQTMLGELAALTAPSPTGARH